MSAMPPHHSNYLWLQPHDVCIRVTNLALFPASPPADLVLISPLLGAIVEPSFVTNAMHYGRLADAKYGERIDFLRMRSWSPRFEVSPTISQR